MLNKKSVTILLLIAASLIFIIALANDNNGCSDGRCTDGDDRDKGKGNDKEIHHPDNDGDSDDGDDDNGDDDGSDDDDDSDDGSGDDDGSAGDGSGDNSGGDTGTTGQGTITSLSLSAPLGFSGIAFGSGDCERVSILSKQLNNKTLRDRALYYMDIIAIDDWDYRSVEEFIKYRCSKTNLTFFSEPLYGGGGGSSYTVDTIIPEHAPINVTVPKKTGESILKKAIPYLAAIMLLIFTAIGYLWIRYENIRLVFKKI